jgi:hypothetical protein
MGKTLSEIYNINDNNELKDLFKERLMSLYNIDEKLTTRLVDRSRELPTFRVLCKFLNIPIKIVSLYEYMNLPVYESKERLSRRHKYTYGEVYNIFKENGCELESTEIKDVFTKVNYVCSCGNKSTMKISDFIQGHRCDRCGRQKTTEAKYIPYGKVVQIYKEANCELMVTEKEYLDNYNSKLLFMCECGELDRKTFKGFRLTTHCKKCSKELQGLENHYAYKGGRTPINEYLRRHLYQWREDSYKKSNFKCTFTKSKNIVCHHLYRSFSEITEDIFKETNLLKSNIADYTNEELSMLENLNLRKHYDIGLGISIDVNLHKLFHTLYGNKNNTVEQFKSFFNRIIYGEFNDLLKSKKLTLDINYEVINELLN